jgi:transcriptional regulator with XRE-family HTH domain
MTGTLGDKIIRLRQDKDITQKELAKLLHIDQSMISYYEKNKKRPSYEVLAKIADIFDVSVDYLLGRTDDPRPVEEITDAHQRIEEALADDPEAEELLAFWKELKEREDLFLLFKQVRPLSDDSIRRVIRVIKAIEDEEAKEFGDE